MLAVADAHWHRDLRHFRHLPTEELAAVTLANTERRFGKAFARFPGGGAVHSTPR
jgi:hypothetical protein